jgi:hypothetical protein
VKFSDKQCSYKFLTYLLTPWSRVLLGKLTGSQLVTKFPTFYGTRRFITEFTSARQLSLSWASSNRSILSHCTCWRSVLILSSHLRLGLPSGLFPSVSLPKPVHASPLTIRATCPAFIKVTSKLHLCTIDCLMSKIYKAVLIKLSENKSRHNLINSLSSAACFGFVIHLQSEYKIAVWTVYCRLRRCNIKFITQLRIQSEGGLQSRNMKLIINY